MAHRPDELPDIIDLVHDHWISLDDVALVEDNLRIPVTDRAMQRVDQDTIFPWTLVIRHVETWSFDDQAEVGFYNINDLAYDGNERSISLRCGVPLVISARVREVEVSLE